MEASGQVKVTNQNNLLMRYNYELYVLVASNFQYNYHNNLFAFQLWVFQNIKKISNIYRRCDVLD